MSKVYRPRSKTIDENRKRYDVYLTLSADQTLIDYLAPFLAIRRANDEMRRLLKLGLEVTKGTSAIPHAYSPSRPQATESDTSLIPAMAHQAQANDDPLLAAFGMPAND